MTPAARVAAASGILDQVLEGQSAEQSLTNWARQSRFAGSGDRAAVRDLVFDALRRQRSLAWVGGCLSGRGLMIGRIRYDGEALSNIFTGEGHAPAALSAEEEVPTPSLEGAPDPVRLDCPDWFWPEIEGSLGEDTERILTCLQGRAPVHLRVNTSRTSVDGAIRSLGQDDIAVETVPLSPTALLVTENPRRVHSSAAYLEGLVELQDAASQAVVDVLLPFAKGATVLDYCAGGGGKALHLAAGGAARVVAHDADPRRMRDIPARAKRAGLRVEISEAAHGEFDCVLIDVPCSGSGAWRRQPEAKWRLTPERLANLNATQDAILETAKKHVAPGGILAYATCSLLSVENDVRVDTFLSQNADWSEVVRRHFTPLDGGDGFFVAALQKER